MNRHMSPEAFYNSLVSEKMDVLDHYTAWRQAQDQGAAGALQAARARANGVCVCLGGGTTTPHGGRHKTRGHKGHCRQHGPGPMVCVWRGGGGRSGPQVCVCVCVRVRSSGVWEVE